MKKFFFLSLGFMANIFVSCNKDNGQLNPSKSNPVLALVMNATADATFNVDPDVYSAYKDYIDYEGDFAAQVSMRNDRPIGIEDNVRFTVATFGNFTNVGNNFEIGIGDKYSFQPFGMQTHPDDATDYFAKVSHNTAAGKNIAVKFNTSPIGPFQVSAYLPEKLTITNPDQNGATDEFQMPLSRYGGFDLTWNGDSNNEKGVFIEILWTSVNNGQGNTPGSNTTKAHYILTKDNGQYHIGSNDLQSIPNGHATIKIMRGNASLMYAQGLKEPVAALFYDGVRIPVTIK